MGGSDADVPDFFVLEPARVDRLHVDVLIAAPGVLAVLVVVQMAVVPSHAQHAAADHDEAAALARREHRRKGLGRLLGAGKLDLRWMGEPLPGNREAHLSVPVAAPSEHTQAAVVVVGEDRVVFPGHEMLDGRARAPGLAYFKLTIAPAKTSSFSVFDRNMI